MPCIRNLALLFSLSTLAATGALPVHAQFTNSKAVLVPASARVTLEPTKTRYFLGENIVAYFGVKNTGTKSFKVGVGGDYRFAARHMRFKVTAVDSEGKQLADPYPSTFNMGGLGGDMQVMPSESWYDTLSLQAYRRFELPGIYKITAQHDLGWKTDAEHPLPVAETQIELVMPSPEEAKKIVDEVDATSEISNSTMGERNPKPSPDFGAMSYPVYLPILMERIDAGKLRYLQSVANIETPEATKALVERLKSSEPTAKAAANVLAQRIPISTWRANFLGTNEEAAKTQREQKVATSWRDEFVPATREYALRAIKSSDRDTLRTATSMLENIGTAEDLPAVLAALNVRIESTVRVPRWNSVDYEDENQQGWQFQDDCLMLIRSARALVNRGAILPPESATNPASIAARMNPYAAYEGDLTVSPQAKWLKHPVPFIRQLTLETLSSTSNREQKISLKPEVRAMLPILLKDPDTSVRIATCDLIGKTGDKRLLPQILPVFSKASSRWEISSAQHAAESLGGQYQVWKIWADRLDEKGMLQPAIESLAGVIENKRSTGWRNDKNEAEGKILKPRWQQFLKANRARLEQGKKFSIEEATWPKDMFPKQFSMN